MILPRPPSSAACRAWEDRLQAFLEPFGRTPSLRVPPDPHTAGCAACAAGAASLEEVSALLSGLSVPAPDPRLLKNLASLRDQPAPRDSVRETLAFLAPGELRRPKMGKDLAAALASIPRRQERALLPRSLAPRPSGDPATRGGFDWRVGVALAYAAAVVLAVVLGLDPASLARRTATDATASGERALADARKVAARRLSATAPLREKLDYRIYRAVAVSRAKVSAWTSLILERVLSPAGTIYETERTGTRGEPSSSSRRRSSLSWSGGEPSPPLFRS